MNKRVTGARSTIPPRVIRSRFSIIHFTVLSLTLGFATLSCSPLREPGQREFDANNLAPKAGIAPYVSTQKRANQNPGLALGIALSGGGSRSANFSAAILAALENVNGKNLLNEIDYMGASSTGAFVAGGYIRARLDHIATNGSDAGFRYQTFLDQGQRQFLAANHEKLITNSLLNPALLGPVSRLDHMERYLDDHVLGYSSRGRSLTLGDIFQPANSGRRPLVPYLFISSTIYQNGHPFVHTPELYQQYEISRVRHRLHMLDISQDRYQAPLAIALASAISVPLIMPPMTLESAFDPANPYLHLVDSGMSDNLGFNALLEAMRKDPASRKVIILVDSVNRDPEPFSRRRFGPFLPEGATRLLYNMPDTNRNHQYALFENTIKTNAKSQILSARTQDGIVIIVMSFILLEPELTSRAIKGLTRLKVKDDQQETWFEAGQQVVKLQTKSLLEHIR